MEPTTSVYAKLSSMMTWRMIQTIIRVWLDVVDTDGKQKKAADWQLQEISLKALRCCIASRNCVSCIVLTPDMRFWERTASWTFGSPRVPNTCIQAAPTRVCSAWRFLAIVL